MIAIRVLGSIPNCPTKISNMKKYRYIINPSDYLFRVLGAENEKEGIKLIKVTESFDVLEEYGKN